MCDEKCIYASTSFIAWMPLGLKDMHLFCCPLHDKFHYCSTHETFKDCLVVDGDYTCCTISGLVKGASPEPMATARSMDYTPMEADVGKDALDLFLNDSEENRRLFRDSILADIPHDLTDTEISALYSSLHNGLVSRCNKFPKKKSIHADRSIKEGMLQALIETNRVTKRLKHTSLRNNRWKDNFKKAVILSLSINSFRKTQAKKYKESHRRKIINRAYKRCVKVIP